MRVLIIGGYGVFGGRLATLLADEPRLTLIIAGRSRAKAEAFCAALPPGVGREPADFDRNGDVAARIALLAPDLVVDASGPFQAYGEAPYRVVEAALERGVPYLDLADGTDFVLGVSRFEDRARKAGVFVLSGVSTCPVLSSAAARRLAQGMDRVDTIEAGIAPSPWAGVGLNVVRAITAYAGKPVALRDDSRDSTGVGLTNGPIVVIRPPGWTPMPPLRFALVDVPDLPLLPTLWPEVRRVWFGAGTRPQVLQALLTLAAWGVRLRLLPSLSRFAPLIHWVTERVRFGDHRGGMFVRVRGTVSGEPVERSWNLIAEGDDGPFIPSMPAEAIIRRLLDGKSPAAGARPALNALDLEDYGPAFAKRAIRTGVYEKSAATAAQPLYRRVLGEAYDALPAAIRALHDLRGPVALCGRAKVERGTGLLSRLIALRVGFPAADEDVPVSVAFEPLPGGERWRRTFAGRSFSSDQTEGEGRWAGLIRERFGPLVFGLAPVVEGGRLILAVRRWSAFGLVLPLWLSPQGPAFEAQRDGRFHFHVEIGHPFCGLIVRYQGWLAASP